MPSQPTPPPWHTHLTIDLLAKILQNSLFHPFIAWLLPLCQLALSSHSSRIYYTCIYASCITALHLLSKLNRRIAYGAPRTMELDREVIVITGGASGLGRILAQMYGMRGASVAVLDVQEPGGGEEEWGAEGWRWYGCDVSDPKAVERVKGLVEEELGTPTILINNAALLSGSKPLLTLTHPELTRSLSVNLLAPFTVLRTFLPAILSESTNNGNGATIVTISSVLGKLGSANLSDYTAAKAGLIAMHTSLRAELAPYKNIKTILVTPGQLSTTLFAGVKTPSQFFGPVVEPTELAREIVRMVDAGEGGEVSLPLYARWIEWMFVLPVGLQRVVRAVSGVDRAMEGFEGPKSQ